MTYFLLTKQKLVYLQRVVNLVLVILLAIILNKNMEQYLEIEDSEGYADTYSSVQYLVASSDMRYVFDKLISDNGLVINNKNIEYNQFRELDDTVKGSYQLGLSGTYLQLLNYLEFLYNNDMLHSIDKFSLTVRSYDFIDIKMNLESLYETE